MFPDSKVLLTEWQMHKEKVLKLAELHPATSVFIGLLTEDSDDGIFLKFIYDNEKRNSLFCCWYTYQLCIIDNYKMCHKCKNEGK